MCGGEFLGQLLYNTFFSVPLKHCLASLSLSSIFLNLVCKAKIDINWIIIGSFIKERSKKFNVVYLQLFHLMYFQMHKLINYTQPIQGLSRDQIVG